jgi:predicted AAA+ superfamily ATPase
VVENVCNWFPDAEASYYRTSNGAEIDLVLESGGTRIIIEAKASLKPSLTRGFWTARDDLSPQASFICAPVNDSYPFKEDVTVIPLVGLKTRLSVLGFGEAGNN